MKTFALAAALAVMTFSYAKAADFTEYYPTLAGEPIDWKVGDTAEYNVSAFGMDGSMTKSVTKDEGTALWVHTSVNTAMHKETIDALYNKADGKVLRVIINGKEQAPEVPEIISQTNETITVPAGTFNTTHTVAKTKKAPKLDIWSAPRETVIEGTVKQIMKTSMGFDVTTELKSFKRAP